MPRLRYRRDIRAPASWGHIPSDVPMTFAMGCEAVCRSCGRQGEIAMMTIRLRLPSERMQHLVCPRCCLHIELPEKCENRFIRALEENQTDGFGNVSTFRTSLAELIRQQASSGRAYTLTRINPPTVVCPADGSEFEAWSNYPDPPILICSKCEARAVEVLGCNWVSGSVLTPW